MPCVVGKAKKKPFEEGKYIAEEELDVVSIDTTRPITPEDTEGNVYLHLIVDAATGHTQWFPLKKKGEAAAAFLRVYEGWSLQVARQLNGIIPISQISSEPQACLRNLSQRTRSLHRQHHIVFSKTQKLKSGSKQYLQ